MALRGLAGGRRGPGAGLVVASLALAGGAMLTACGSSGHASAAGTPLQQACSDVTAVLGNGPDPDADPIGYAAAQPIQLRKIVTSDTDLRADLAALARAYQSVVSTKGSSGAERAVKSASARVDGVCPGATS